MPTANEPWPASTSNRRRLVSLVNIEITTWEAYDAEFFPGMDKQWGLSFMINNEEAPTGRSPGSLAWAGLANTYYWIDQQKGVGGVYISQILPFVDVKALPLFYAFESTVYGK